MSSEVRPSLAGMVCPTPIRHDDHVLLGHGSGGKLTAELIEQIVLPAFRNPMLEALDDQALVELGDAARGRVAFTTDSYVVSPLFFPGGDIGCLAVHGTVNDLAVGGARPVALSMAFILEEGLPMKHLRRIVASACAAAERVGVPVVTGDTKVVGHGHGDGIFINTSGIGVVPLGIKLGSARVRPGDTILLSGTIGDHGIAVMAQREGLELEGEVASDTAPLDTLVEGVLDAAPGTHAMRDPTRGGLAATLVEIATRQKLGMEIREDAVPMKDTVRGACELLGLDPWLVANEGKLVAFVPEEQADAALTAMRAHPLGRDAARIGRVTAASAGRVTAKTRVGGKRIVDLPHAEPLPRIC